MNSVTRNCAGSSKNSRRGAIDAMSASTRSAAGDNFLRRSLLWSVIVILSLVLAWLVYFRVIIPGRDAASLNEENLPALKVVVKNGCGVENLAADYAAHIKGRNIDVIGMEDTPLPIYNKSIIEVKMDDRQDLERLQKMTGIGRFTLAVDPQAPAPFVIILGEDFEEYMKP